MPTYRVRQLWPIVLADCSYSITIGALLVNSVLFSQILWPGEPFHTLEMGAIITIQTWTSAVSGMVVGRIADKHNRKRELSIAILLIGVCLIFKSLLPAGLGGWSYLYLVPCYFLDGWGGGSIMPVVLSYTNDALETDSRSQFFGVFFGCDQFAMIGGMLFGSFMFEMNWWREFFWIMGVIAFVAAALVQFRLAEPKRGIQHKELGEVLQNPDIEYAYTLTGQTAKKTFLRPTNIVAFVEGMFTCVLIAATNFLIFPYLQNAPHNFSAFSAALVVVMFGLPGTLLGTIVLSSLSDRLGKKDIRNRLSLIAFAIFWLAMGEILLFLIPAPLLAPTQGEDFIFIISTPVIWVLGLVIFSVQAVYGLYAINQSPVIQAINLPEAQGTIMAWNQVLQTLGLGLAPLLAGAVLAVSSSNYLLAAGTCVLFGIPGGILWIYGRKKIVEDIAHIDLILRERATQLGKANADASHKN